MAQALARLTRWHGSGAGSADALAWLRRWHGSGAVTVDALDGSVGARDRVCAADVFGRVPVVEYGAPDSRCAVWTVSARIGQSVRESDS